MVSKPQIMKAAQPKDVIIRFIKFVAIKLKALHQKRFDNG